jgi:type VI secretion system secreted protein VgrG
MNRGPKLQLNRWNRKSCSKVGPMASSTVLKFTLKIGSLAPDSFRVLEFTMDEAISGNFVLHIQAASENGDIAYADMIGKDTTLKVNGEDFPISHHGIVTEFNQYPDASENFGHESFLYDIVVEPHLSLLGYTTQSRIFHKLSVKDIIEKVLTGNSLAASTNFQFRLTATYPVREYTVQYNETDLNFISRLMEEEGIFYFFDHAGEKDVLIMGDKLEAIKPLAINPEVELQTESGLSHLAVDHITKLRRTQRMVTGKVTLKDYNDRTPSVNVLGRAAKPGQGEDYSFSPNVATPSEAERLATLRAEMHACRKVIIDGEGICRSFRAGMRFELKDPNDQSHFAGKYTLTRVSHHGDQREGFEGDKDKIIYNNTFKCIPADTIYRPAQQTLKPKVHGIMTAKVDGAEGQYAFLDEDGRYHAKLPFDLTDAKDGSGSLPIRMNQPYGGPNYGMHFPIHNGNEIILSFVDGDVDRPIALGTVPNPNNVSPVNKRNNHESVIRTASGHQIRLDDKESKTAIDVTTKGKHSLSLNDDPDVKEIHVKTTDANELVMDDKNKNIRIMTPAGAHTLKMDYDKKVLSLETKYGHKVTMDDEAKAIAIQTKDGHILRLDDDKKMLTLQDGKGKHVFQIDAGGDLISITTSGDMEWTAKGSLNIAAKEITMEAKQGAVNIKGKQDVSIDGMNVDVKGKQKVTLEAKMDASISGLNLKLEGKMNVDSKAGLQNKMSGVMTNVESQAINTIKGAMVMVN